MPETWLLPTLALLPVMLGSFWGIGVPWALVILPRVDWRDRVLVAVFGLALGAVLLTTGMFLLGTFGTITPGGALLIGGIVALAGIVLAWQRAWATVPAAPAARAPLVFWQWVILVSLLLALVLRIVRVAFWPFAAYDALWVYAYNARVFTLTGQIPPGMGYYPQFLPLSFTFGQLIWGGINDHAARAVIPILGMASIGAAYLLGARLAGRRIGWLTMALWAFAPAHADWARFGDLEVPLTLFFTLAALFFLLAWRDETPARWRYAVASGLMLAGGMWTKPTAGALVWGIGLVFAAAAFRLRGNWRAVWLRFRLVIVVGLFSAPIGGMWYIRNLLHGHPAVVFPPAYWLTQAQRSGRQLFLPLALLALLALAVLLQPRRSARADARLLIPGLLLMVGGALPSAGLMGAPTHRLTLLELGVMLAGLALYAAGVVRWLRGGGAQQVDRPALAGAGDVLALILPYWITWFWSYSYHPRLTFAIVPLQLFLAARLLALAGDGLAAWFTPEHRRRVGRPAVLAGLALALYIVPGLAFTIHDTAPHLITGELQTDDDKHLASNYALMRTVNVLRTEVENSERPLSIAAPGSLRLPFFFPEIPVNTDPVTDLHVLDDGVTHFIDGFEAENAYAGLGQGVNPARGALGLPRRARLLAHEVDGDFYYDTYRINTSVRFTNPEYNGILQEPVIYPDFAEVLGFAVTGRDFWPGRRLVLNIYFHVLGRVENDYTIYLHVTDGERVVATWDHQPGSGQYVTSLWEPGEYIEDQLWVELAEDVPAGTYQVIMGLYDHETGERLTALVGGEMTDGFVLIDVMNQLSEAPDSDE